MATKMPGSRRIPHEVWERGTSRGIRIGQWEIETRKQAILNASEIEDAATRLDIPLPEITFGNNLVSLKRKGKQRALDPDAGHDLATGTTITFNGLDALAQVDTTGEDTIKVAYADKWARSRNLENASSGNTDDTSSIIETVKNYDWTYSTSYAGTCEGSTSFQPAPVDHAGIPLSRLAKQDEPILFFDEVVLFEDELHDNGVANLTIRIRVMPSGLFLLSRFFLRVDNVLFRIFDVRLYHDFSSGEIIRETKGKEAPYDAVRKHLPRERADDLTPLTDHNWVANALGMLEKNSANTEIKQTKHHLAGPTAGTSTFDGSTAAPWSQAQRRTVTAQDIILSVPSTASPEDKRPWTGLGTKLDILNLG